MRAAVKRTILAGAALVMAAAASAQAPQANAAAQLLMRSMQRTFPVNVVAVISQRDPRSDGAFQRVKVERRKDGSARLTILAPLRMQGVTSVDDGERLKTYLPDDKIVLDQESPAKAPCQIEQRIALAARNYTFRTMASGKIAGRPTVCVVAKPLNDALETRRYYLDQATGYPLRLETLGEGNEITVVFETKDIQYPKVLDNKLFELQPNGARLIKYSRPTPVLGAVHAKSLVGFEPIVPEGLPMGFQVQEIQFNDSPEWKSIVVRLTDGLARATVYQWKGAATKVKTVEDSTILDHKGVRLMLVSDLSPRLRLELLKAFIAQASSDPEYPTHRLYGMTWGTEAGLAASLELVKSLWAFADLDGLDSYGSGYSVVGL